MKVAKFGPTYGLLPQASYIFGRSSAHDSIVVAVAFSMTKSRKLLSCVSSLNFCCLLVEKALAVFDYLFLQDAVEIYKCTAD
jgi:hypothetical protein